ncbi:MBL fold metallo-hydrolase RNA specificity domain-containing protein [Microbacterium sulfonylureivorans]|uniref:MBL fold metallo-hydrolase RNA specificity domain-containing protein n=1 Tax=Microbacterium sulfonylureivorans TaxID=2486854 RepID=UPI000FDB0A1D|nr:MBL fold metallo-hydrolase [Microbacterium sulfonylureivorans]
MSSTLQFLGAADTVTGSRYLITTPSTRVLVDCGLFQGYKHLRDRNRAPFPVPPDSIDAVVVSHAHLDHSGYLPALVRDGFHGRIFSTEGTAGLSRIMLPDSAHLLEEEARFAAKHTWSKHAHPEPLYTGQDAERALERFVSLPFDDTRHIAGDVDVLLSPAGHILGASTVRLTVRGGSVLQFTGDLGRASDPLMRPPAPRHDADVLITESTYGDREHGTEDPEPLLGDLIRRVAARGGVVLIPAFAVGRTETILLHLSRLHDRREIPDIPIFINSPMAANVADLYRRHPEEHRVDAAELDRMYRLAKVVRTVDESKLLNLRGGPMIVISASGMLTGGRILHHLRAYGSDRGNAVVLTGFQAGGTRGAALLAGARSLRIFGKDVPIRAEVVNLDLLSAHADANELLAWMRSAASAPEMVYVTHGEPSAADRLRARIIRELGWNARVPEHLETVPIG